jgi:pre-mRNA-splicing factor SPF27
MAAEEESAPEIYDSLPYYDNELERYPHLKEVVDREFAKVPKPPSTLHSKVPPEVNLFAVRLSHTRACMLVLMK